MYDEDVWGLNCGNSMLYDAGSGPEYNFDGGGAEFTAGVLEVFYDPAEHAVAFRQGAKQLGRFTGLPPAVKLVVSMANEKSTVKLL